MDINGYVHGGGGPWLMFPYHYENIEVMHDFQRGARTSNLERKREVLGDDSDIASPGTTHGVPVRLP